MRSICNNSLHALSGTQRRAQGVQLRGTFNFTILGAMDLISMVNLLLGLQFLFTQLFYIH